MVDEKKVIRRLESRIDEYVKKYPDKNTSEEVETIREFIHMLQLEAESETE